MNINQNSRKEDFRKFKKIVANRRLESTVRKTFVKKVDQIEIITVEKLLTLLLLIIFKFLKILPQLNSKKL